MKQLIILTSLAFALSLGGVIIGNGSPAVAAGEGGPLIVLPGNAPRYGGQQGREADTTELLATGEQTGGALGLFRQTIAPGSGPPTHLHRTEDEFLYVVSGGFRFRGGGRAVQRP